MEVFFEYMQAACFGANKSDGTPAFTSILQGEMDHTVMVGDHMRTISMVSFYHDSPMMRRQVCYA